MSRIETVLVAAPAAPIAGATAVIFNSTRMDGGTTDGVTAGWCRAVDATWFELSFLSVNQDSAASGLIFYESKDGGTNWDQIEAGITVSATSAGVVDPNPYRRYLGNCSDFKCEYTAGGTGPTVWRLLISIVIGDHARIS